MNGGTGGRLVARWWSAESDPEEPAFIVEANVAGAEAG